MNATAASSQSAGGSAATLRSLWRSRLLRRVYCGTTFLFVEFLLIGSFHTSKWVWVQTKAGLDSATLHSRRRGEESNEFPGDHGSTGPRTNYPSIQRMPCGRAGCGHTYVLMRRILYNSIVGWACYCFQVRGKR